MAADDRGGRTQEELIVLGEMVVKAVLAGRLEELHMADLATFWCAWGDFELTEQEHRLLQDLVDGT